ncbi:hypothetical protein [Streptomyces sp. NPDC059783]|uniref:hypothetical protein n=1 Tax=Streptomyces sp. NPDC059783 TaxID=3346944 RepID=UPI00365BF352
MADPIARFKNIGGAVVAITEQSGYLDVKHPTEHLVVCSGCGASHRVTWGYDLWHEEQSYGGGLKVDFDSTGREYLPAARKWAQDHAAKCRAL